MTAAYLQKMEREAFILPQTNSIQTVCSEDSCIAHVGEKVAPRPKFLKHIGLCADIFAHA